MLLLHTSSTPYLYAWALWSGPRKKALRRNSASEKDVSAWPWRAVRPSRRCSIEPELPCCKSMRNFGIESKPGIAQSYGTDVLIDQSTVSRTPTKFYLFFSCFTQSCMLALTNTSIVSLFSMGRRPLAQWSAGLLAPR